MKCATVTCTAVVTRKSAFGPSPKYCSKECRKSADHKARVLNGYFSNMMWARKERWVNEIGGCCAQCGEDSLPCLDFDHLDPSEKYMEVCAMIRTPGKYPDEVIRAEVHKCQILCANCHRKKTALTWHKYKPS